MSNKTARFDNLLITVGSLVLIAFSVTALPDGNLPLEKASGAPVAAMIQSLPMAFEENQGQADAKVRYLARGAGYTLILNDRESVLRLGDKTSSSELRMRLQGSQTPRIISGENRLPGVSNYLLGQDSKSWRTDVPHFGKVRMVGVYPGIDLVYYGNGGQLEYDFVVAPGKNPRDIELAYEGMESIRIDQVGDLVMTLKSGEVRHRAPVAYQDIDGKRHNVTCRFVIGTNRRVSFAVGSYDRSKVVVIDPKLDYSTYFGGSGDDYGRALAVDSQGNLYFCGITSSNNFPVTSGVIQTTNGGGTGDVFVAKINLATTAPGYLGATLVYSTYLGGSNNDQPTDLAVDATGNVYVTGFTYSSDFPLSATPLQGSLKGIEDSFVTKLNTTGSSLIFSTYLGGSDIDEGRGLALDSSGNVFITGRTNSADFPIAGMPLQSTRKTTMLDAFVSKINSAGSALIYSTFLGGSSSDDGNDIAVDAAGNAYVCGQTFSADFPLVGTPFQAARKGETDSFICKLNPDGSGLVYATYIGGSNGDYPHHIAIDGGGNAYVTGETFSPDFPVTPAVFQPTHGGGGFDGFITKLNPSGSALVYSSFLGGNARDTMQTLAVDSAGRAYVAGYSASTNFPTVLPLQATKSGGSNDEDCVISRVSASGEVLEFSTYHGGSNIDACWDIALDSSNNVYFGGRTASTNFPLAGSPVIQLTPGGKQDTMFGRITIGSMYSYSYWVPVASHVPGDFNSQWRTDVGILNPNTSRVDLEVHFYKKPNEYTKNGFVAPGAQSVTVDAVAQMGQLGSGAIEIRSTLPVKVSSRTYNLNPTTVACYPKGTLGQDLDGVTSEQGLSTGQSAFLPQLAENDAYRTNIAVTNTGTTRATVNVDLFDGAGNRLNGYAVTLEPGEWQQKGKPFRLIALQTNMSRGYAKVTVVSGSGIFAFASVTDNITNDPTTVLMQR